MGWDYLGWRLSLFGAGGAGPRWRTGDVLLINLGCRNRSQNSILLLDPALRL